MCGTCMHTYVWRMYAYVGHTYVWHMYAYVGHTYVWRMYAYVCVEVRMPCMCMATCICIRIYIYVYIYIYTHSINNTYAIHMRGNAYMLIHRYGIRVWQRVYVYIRMYTHSIYICVYTSMCVYIHIYTLVI